MSFRRYHCRLGEKILDWNDVYYMFQEELEAVTNS